MFSRGLNSKRISGLLLYGEAVMLRFCFVLVSFGRVSQVALLCGWAVEVWDVGLR